MMNLNSLFQELADVFSGELAIEKDTRAELLSVDASVNIPSGAAPLPRVCLDVMAQPNAHPICKNIASIPFTWAPPQSSKDPLYAEHSIAKVHVELLGPDGLVKSDKIRLGLYGMLPNAEYGIRTHPAEEIYIMLAGEVDWIRGHMPYTPHLPNERSYHPSMMPHASRTRSAPFMSVYSWRGDISTDEYVYEGLPNT